MTLLTEPELYKITYALFPRRLRRRPRGHHLREAPALARGPAGEAILHDLRLDARRALREAASKSSNADASSPSSSRPSPPTQQRPTCATILEEQRRRLPLAAHRSADRRTSMAFHRQFALERGVNFITPILKDADEDLIQVFSGEWMVPGGPPDRLLLRVRPAGRPERRAAEAARGNRVQPRGLLPGQDLPRPLRREGARVPERQDTPVHRRGALPANASRRGSKGLEVFEIEDSLLEQVEADMKEHAASRRAAAPRKGISGSRGVVVSLVPLTHDDPDNQPGPSATLPAR